MGKALLYYYMRLNAYRVSDYMLNILTYNR